MRVTTLIRYLFGHRQSIIAVAHCPPAVWLGFVFVLSAGFAREYDGEDLLHEPWHVLLPFGASLLTSYLLYLLLQTPGRRPTREGPAQSPSRTTNTPVTYLDFLGLYWMTAPLAWLYAIPVERYVDAADAVRANLWLLGLVSVWRVALMTRVVSVIYRHSIAASFFLVMLFADTVAMVVIWLTPLPILSVMGGIRLTESEEVLQSVGFFLRFFGVVTWPVWLIGTAVLVARSRRKRAGSDTVASDQGSSDQGSSDQGSSDQGSSDQGSSDQGSSDQVSAKPILSVSWRLWCLAALSILVWLPLLPLTQIEQINRRRAETDLRGGRVAEALRFMSERERGDFPPHWDPPPRVGYGERTPPLLETVMAAEDPAVALCVRELCRDTLVVQANALSFAYEMHAIQLDDMDDAQLEAYVKLLQSLPMGAALARYHKMAIARHELFDDAGEPIEDVGISLMTCS